MNNVLRMGSLSLLVLTACSQPAPSPSTPRAPQASAGPPLVVSWTSQGGSPSDLRLVARLEFRSAFGAPVQVSVAVPPGVTITSGESTLTVTAPADLAPIEKEYRFAVAPGATGEIVVDAVARGTGWGVRAKDAYEVGSGASNRTTAERVAPQQGTGLRVNGVDLGPTDKLDSNPPASR